MLVLPRAHRCISSELACPALARHLAIASSFCKGRTHVLLSSEIHQRQGNPQMSTIYSPARARMVRGAHHVDALHLHLVVFALAQCLSHCLHIQLIRLQSSRSGLHDGTPVLLTAARHDALLGSSHSGRLSGTENERRKARVKWLQGHMHAPCGDAGTVFLVRSVQRQPVRLPVHLSGDLFDNLARFQPLELKESTCRELQRLG